MGNIGTQELLIILAIVLLLFGAKRIPEIARSMGHGIREFKRATREISADVTKDEDDRKKPGASSVEKPGAE